MTDQELSPDQYFAITRSIELGKTLIKDHPEIAGLYRQSNSLHTIMEELDIQSNYGVGYNVAREGVHRAITGHKGSFKLSQYEGLIPNQEEREKLGIEHMQESGRKAYEEGLGVHGRTAEQMIEAGRKIYEEGLGIHGRTAEQMSEDARKSVIAQGKTPWGESKQIERLDNPPFDLGSEIELAYFLSQCPNHQRGSQVNNKKIADQLNYFYHDGKEVRTTGAVQVNLSNYRKSLDDMVV